MQILTAEQIRAWDQYTIENEPISSLALMERSAAKCTEWLLNKRWEHKLFYIFCGSGNNGGDGLAIGRMLFSKGYTVLFYLLESTKTGSADYKANLQQLQQIPSASIFVIGDHTRLPVLQKEDIVLDALFGSGLNRPLEGLAKIVVGHINTSGARVVSIDVPSGLFLDKSAVGETVVEANFTLTFECYKTALLVQENAPFVGEVNLLPIGLDHHFLSLVNADTITLDQQVIRSLYKPRNRFAHKGSFGHALLVGGSYGKVGAMVLATTGALSSGAGLTTAFIPKCGYTILQLSAPEAMALADENEEILSSLPTDIERFASIGIGPGMGTAPETQNVLSFLVRRYPKPLVIDADGLNCLALNKELLQQLPSNSILTPHPKEFDRLFGQQQSDFERLNVAKQKAAELDVIIVLKGHHTFIATPTGQCYFNTTGNAGMAKGGSGDVLTGILTSLLAQGYLPAEAAQLGVYLHGWAGDVAAEKYSREAMLPSHLIQCIKDVFIALQQ